MSEVKQNISEYSKGKFGFSDTQGMPFKEIPAEEWVVELWPEYCIQFRKSKTKKRNFGQFNKSTRRVC